jgi:2-polyprenyl-6-methoxyphenol hydroxylase-like FAD-dependent oxidoreductase
VTAAAEPADVIVVGARCAGSAVATALAHAGRRVVALDRARFPADTISTHLMWPGGIAELRSLGALERVRALGAPPMPVAFAGGGGIEIQTGYTPVGGIDYAMCVRRIGLDAALVATAREAGAEVREGARVTDLIWDAGRVAGVRYENGTGALRALRAPVVIGADGRRSTVARLVGAQQPYRRKPSGRACFYAYWDDARPEWRHVAAQWREQGELGTAFPCDGGLVLVLLQPPVARVSSFREDLAGSYERAVGAIPGLAARLDGCRLAGKVRSATGIESYFRHSSGPGWALAGDAGHFKDPVTAQGIRDALRHGRLLGEAVAPTLEHAKALDPALRGWEHRRESDCLAVYQWTNLLARGEPMTALEIELYRAARERPALARELADVFARTRPPSKFLTPARLAILTARALLNHPERRRATLTGAHRELVTAATDWYERQQASAHRLRSDRAVS